MRRGLLLALLLVAATLALAGCSATDTATTVPTSIAAPPQTAELDWVEPYPAKSPALVFSVASFTVTKEGWSANVSVENRSDVGYKIVDRNDEAALGFGVMLFPTGNQEDLDRLNKRLELPTLRPATSSEPALPVVLERGATWSGTISARGALAGGLWVRICVRAVLGRRGRAAGNAVAGELDHRPRVPPGGGRCSPGVTAVDSRVRRWLPLIILAAAQFVMVLDSSVMNVSISQIVADLDTTVTGVQGAITMYTLVMAAFMLVGAKLGDIWGRDRAFAIGLAVYGLGSLMTALSPNLYVLLFGWSLVEGLGAVLVIPAIAALTAANYEGKDRAFAYGIIGGVAGAAIAVGPVIGGFVTTYYSWRYVFVGEVVIVIAVLILRKQMAAGTTTRASTEARLRRRGPFSLRSRPDRLRNPPEQQLGLGVAPRCARRSTATRSRHSASHSCRF